MKKPHRKSLYAECVLLTTLIVPFTSPGAQGPRWETKTSIASGWHPWYEVKADPENAKNLILCGTQWDAPRNAPIGFVYTSADGGMTWQATLKDKSTSWVTEQSCAFGGNHRAYFISESSQVIDGRPHHEFGTTRLFSSIDSGQHWTETIKTGWADYSTSAVNSASGKLYTLFNSWNATRDQGRNWGANVGLLVFSSDGKEVEGPFFNSAIWDLGYRSIFPKDAVALKGGSVIALYFAKKQTAAGWFEDLGVIRADHSSEPLLEHTIVAHPSIDDSCFNFSDASLAYDYEHDRLFLVYMDGCGDSSRIMLTLSDDEGRTWAKSAALAGAHHPDLRAFTPSLVVNPRSVLGLLWEEGQERHSGRWLFSYIRELRLAEPPTELSRGSDKYEVSSDSLWTTLYKPNEIASVEQKDVFHSSLTLKVSSELNIVWRATGLIAMGDKFLAVWPSGNSEGMQLCAAVLAPADSVSNEKSSIGPKDCDEPDITAGAMLLYGGTQHMDNASGTLKVCLTLANRGSTPIRKPIKLKADDVRSAIGAVSILNAANGSAGAGALWDISNSVTGDQIPPGAASNPFCLTFRLEIPPKHVLREQSDLLLLRVKVLASSGSSQTTNQSKN